MTRRVGYCTECHREGVEVQPRRSHGERVLCDRCTERPHVISSAGLDTSGSFEPEVSPTVELSDALGIGTDVTHAEIHGRGPEARVVLALVDGTVLDVERYADLLKPSALEAVVTCGTGKVVTYKKGDAQRIASLIFQVADHHDASSDRDEARGWGMDFLRRADVIDADTREQVQRWGAFVTLDALEPVEKARMAGVSVASESKIIRDHDGARWVVAAWFTAHVRHVAVGAVNLQRLPNLMSAVGWERRGQRGDVKATSPSDDRTIRLRLFRVPDGWEEASQVPTDHDGQVPTGPHGFEGKGPQVPTGPHLRTRAQARARVGGDLRGPASNRGEAA